MSAVAAHAGVRRSTLYRHFPDESALFDACTAHWLSANPPPDLVAWAQVADPRERLRIALENLHAYYGRTERMLENLFRDESIVPPVAERFVAFRGYLASAQETLLEGLSPTAPDAQRIRGAVAHVIAFSTWKSLVREHGVTESDAIRLLCALVDAARSQAPEPTAGRKRG
jgi:AcrR family transcriptional regulator